jgi:hypothetical protein
MNFKSRQYGNKYCSIFCSGTFRFYYNFHVFSFVNKNRNEKLQEQLHAVYFVEIAKVIFKFSANLLFLTRTRFFKFRIKI